MYESDRRYYGYNRNGYDRQENKEFEPKEYAPKDDIKEYEPKKFEPEDDYEPKKFEPKEKEKEKEPDKEFHCKECDFFEGNSVAFDIKKNDCEIRADIIVKKNSCVRIWGRVKSCYDEPVEGALVKLVKVVCWKGRYQYVGLAHTVTDCKGFYQFDICDKEDKAEYRVIVSKAATGKERVIGGYGCCRYDEYDNKPKAD